MKIAGITGISGSGKSTLASSIINQSSNVAFLPQITCRQPRSDDNPKLITHITKNQFDQIPTEEFLVRTNEYGILIEEVLRLPTESNAIAIMGADEIIQLKQRLAQQAKGVLIKYPKFNLKEMQKRTKNRTNFNIEERYKKALQRNNEYFENPEYLNRYIDLIVYSRARDTKKNVNLILELL